MSVSVHVIDNYRGEPAAGVAVRLEQQAADGLREVGGASTGPDGRAALSDAGPDASLVHRVVFEVGAYYRAFGLTPFHPRVVVEFAVDDPAAHVHIPLLITPSAYTTYRGS